MENGAGGWLAMEEAARLAGKTERTIRSWVQLGRLIKRKVGKRVLVRFAEGYAPAGPPAGGPWRPGRRPVRLLQPGPLSGVRLLPLGLPLWQENGRIFRMVRRAIYAAHSL